MLLVTLFAPGAELSAAAALATLYYFVLARQVRFVSSPSQSLCHPCHAMAGRANQFTWPSPSGPCVHISWMALCSTAEGHFAFGEDRVPLNRINQFEKHLGFSSRHQLERHG